MSDELDVGAFLDSLDLGDILEEKSEPKAPDTAATVTGVDAAVSEIGITATGGTDGMGIWATGGTPEEPSESKTETKPQTGETEAEVDELLDSLDLGEPIAAKQQTSPAEPEPDTLDDPLEFFETSGLQPERVVPAIMYPWMENHEFRRVMTVTEANQVVDECIKRGFCSLDLETEGLDNRIIWKDGKPETVHKIVGYCISYDGETGFYIPVRHQPTDGGPSLNVNAEGVEAAISRLCHAAIPEGTPEAIEKDHLSYKCERPKVVICFWNAPFDQEFLFPITGIDWWHPESFEDGMIACFAKYAGDKRLGLKAKSKELLKDPNGNSYQMIELKQLFVGSGRRRAIQFQTLAPDEVGVLRYTGSDGICTYKICDLPEIVPLCHEKHEVTYRIERQTSEVVRTMERNRVRINRAAVRKTLEEEEKKRADLLEKIQQFAKAQGRAEELDPNSPKQLSEFLFTSTGLDITPKPEINKASKQYKTDAETLKGLAKNANAPSILKNIVAFREVEKFIGTYLNGLANNPDENDEIRLSFKQTGAASGRFSAPAGMPAQGYSGIPVHGIPNGSEIRRVFEARPGYTMVKADYAGEELRIAANLSNEPVWINEFLNGSGDLHSITARAFFSKQEVSKEERGKGKTANFVLLYGGGPKSIISATGCTKVEAGRRKRAFDQAVPTFASWIKEQHKKVKKDLGVWTAFGRWLAIPDARSEDRAIRAACERHAVNYQIQGAGADIMKIAMILLHKRLHKRGWLRDNGDDSVRMLLTVHDEVVFEIRHERVAEAIPLIVDAMESPWRMPQNPRWRVPLIVEPLVGFNWASGYEVRRVGQDYKPSENEVVLNGFAYDTTRKPRTDKEGKITESLDQNEVQDGKVFRVVDPPWLTGHKPSNGFTPNVEVQVPATTPEVEAPTAPTAEAKPEPTPAKSEAPTPEISKPLETPKETDSEILVLGINQLNNQTVEQVFDFVWDSLKKDGPTLHLTDIVGSTLVSPRLNLRVNKEKLVGHLRKYNLLGPLRDQDASG
jgi:DNA polymerase I-like protein with 3'-5' exonuclease and polymerase domains